MVRIDGVVQPAMKWSHWHAASDQTDRAGRCYNSKANRVMKELWVPPAWCARMDNYWEAIVDKWLSEEYEQYHAECASFKAYALAHKGKAKDPDLVYNAEDPPEAYSNPSVHRRLNEYTAMDMYGGNESLKARGALSIAVPGEIAGLYEAWKHHGKLPWKRLVLPAARLALAFRISPYLRMQMEATRDGILGNSGTRAVYAPGGDILRAGDVCRNARLAQTLRAVAEHRPCVFYGGAVGARLVRDVREAGGILTVEDLKRYQVKVLNILDQYGIPAGFAGSLGIHRLIESLKHYMAVKMNLGDPDFVNDSEVVSDMISPKFAAELKKTIYDNMTFAPKHYGGRWNILQDHGTSHLSIVDSERNAVSMTSTVNAYFGSLILSPRTGILLNNEMDDFSMPANASENSPPPAPANFVSPLKRPLSSMTPTIVVKDGKLVAAVGASGGSMIPAGTIEVVINHFVKNMDPLASVMAPRVYHQLIPNEVKYENWTTVTGDHFELDAATRADLQKRGHVLKPLAGGTISQLVVHNVGPQGDLTAVSDPRKGGVPAGY
ncbi:glutathione hydrolase 1-like [Miscanthus floridulus]|uniref:glutathione hydrolase 1-like n=1 Tax=Miscanthus floridulus TaxID=154761 RepID=UPI00345812DD